MKTNEKNDADLLRNAVAWLDSRDEYLNDTRKWGSLIQDYLRHCKTIRKDPYT